MSAAIVERIRETLEDALPRGEAAGTLFAALARWGPRVPANHVELTSFVHGPLTEALSKRLAAAPLFSVLASLDEIIATASAPTGDIEIPIDEAPVEWRDEAATKLLRAVTGPVSVLVIAASTSLALRLRLALGEETIDLEVRMDRASTERSLTKEPVLAVIDASDPTSIPVEPLADALVHATKTTSIVWGAESPTGRRLIEAAEARGAQLIGIQSSEGIGTIFDFVTSRRS